jgi:hypothetical protein
MQWEVSSCLGWRMNGSMPCCTSECLEMHVTTELEYLMMLVRCNLYLLYKALLGWTGLAAAVTCKILALDNACAGEGSAWFCAMNDGERTVAQQTVSRYYWVVTSMMRRI